MRYDTVVLVHLLIDDPAGQYNLFRAIGVPLGSDDISSEFLLLENSLLLVMLINRFLYKTTFLLGFPWL